MEKTRLSRTRLFSAFAIGALGLALSGCVNTSSQAVTNGALDGTIWCSPEEHARVAVDRFGSIDVKEGKDICALFTAESGQYVIKIIWWNASKAIHVEEWVIAVPVSETEMFYAETQHDEGSDFPGVIGNGEINLVSDAEMTIVQLGHLVNGSAAGFLSSLVKVDQMPEIPVPVSYPTN